MSRPVWLLGGQTLSSLLALVSAPVIARLIGVEGRGITASVTSLVYIVPILIAVGVPLAVRRTAAVDPSSSHTKPVTGVVAASILPSVLAGVLCALLLLDRSDALTRLISGLWIAVSFLGVWWMCDLAILIARGNFFQVMVMQVASPATLLLGATVMSLTDSGSTNGVLLVGLLGTVLTLLAGRLGVARRKGPKSSVTTSELLRSGVRYYAGAAAEALSNRVLLVIALPILGANAAGLLSIGITVSVFSLVLGQTIGSAYYPLVANSDSVTLRSRALGELAAVLLVLTPILIIVSIYLVPILFGNDFRAAITPMIIMEIGAIPMVMGYCAALFLTARGRGYAASCAQIVGLVIQCSGILLLRDFGAIGGAIAYSAGFSMLAAVALFLLKIDGGALPSPRGVRGGVTALISGPKQKVGV